MFFPRQMPSADRQSKGRRAVSVHKYDGPYDGKPHFIPDDILREIFELCVLGALADEPDHQSFGETDCRYTNKAPWTLTQVSRQWRAVSISLSSIWATITVDADSYFPGQFGGRDPHGERRFQQFLERSKGADLRISWTKMEYLNGPASEVDNILFEMLLSEAKRWRFVKMDANYDLLDKLSNTTFPRLLSFSCHATSSFTIDAPALQHAELFDFSIENPSDTALPWTALKTYRCTDSDLLPITRLSSVTDLTITARSPDSWSLQNHEQASVDPFVCHVRRLTVTDKEVRYMGEQTLVESLLSNFSFTALTTFVLNTTASPFASMITIPIALPCVTKFALSSGISVSIEDFNTLLHAMPALNILWLQAGQTTLRCLETLRIMDIAPRLTALYIDPELTLESDHQAILESIDIVVSSRISVLTDVFCVKISERYWWAELEEHATVREKSSTREAGVRVRFEEVVKEEIFV
ncbi:hypothetical protein CYLTODRAFT_491184 [Cylindrobasidium torrendii FP15055 ss-10]|uniref:F-box domain-containing protein n=1 Tax=Cylindrobasidium torrendii FP15055 ss-10 TaxID=1314674 RepID=A0A0D7BB89_9AGAR|nr:hypothetical protein CYLTODRAFT_491184 [Cylindrobasidium torrendii FP15055 ss-10]